ILSYRCFVVLSSFLLPPPLRSSLFPYTTLFRSLFNFLIFLLQMKYHFLAVSSSLCVLLAYALLLFAPYPTSPPGSFASAACITRSEEHTSELQSREKLVCRLLLEKKKVPQS